MAKLCIRLTMIALLYVVAVGSLTVDLSSQTALIPPSDQAFEANGNHFNAKYRDEWTRSVTSPFVAVTPGFSSSVGAQVPATTCGDAVSQLQNYVGQVNAFANGEYYRGIPMRCGGNPFCMQTWLGYLNQWYMQQSTLVNGWYSTLVRQCTAPNRRPKKKQVEVAEPTHDDVGGLDEDAVDDIEVDDEDRTVRIRIPDTPSGFRRK